MPMAIEAVSCAASYEERGFSAEPRRLRRDPHSAPVGDRAWRRRPPEFFVRRHMTERPGGPTEIHSWIGTIFTEFRELELRLLMGKLGASLGDSFAARLGETLR